MLTGGAPGGQLFTIGHIVGGEGWSVIRAGLGNIPSGVTGGGGLGVVPQPIQSSLLQASRECRRPTYHPGVMGVYGRVGSYPQSGAGKVCQY